MYACSEHEGRINAGQLPEPKRPGRQPRTLAAAVLPGPGLDRPSDSCNTAVASLPLSSPPGPGLPAEDIALQNILRAAHVGHYFAAFQREGVSLEMLPTLEFAELRTAFNFTLKQWRDLQLAMKNARALVAATPSCHEAQLAPTIVLQRPVFRPTPCNLYIACYEPSASAERRPQLPLLLSQLRKPTHQL